MHAKFVDWKSFKKRLGKMLPLSKERSQMPFTTFRSFHAKQIWLAQALQRPLGDDVWPNTNDLEVKHTSPKEHLSGNTPPLCTFLTSRKGLWLIRLIRWIKNNSDEYYDGVISTQWLMTILRKSKQIAKRCALKNQVSVLELRNIKCS